MDHTQRPIDEYTLAAYIAGTLPEDERAEVAAYLAENADARELLQMAYEALEAARHGDPHMKPAGDLEYDILSRSDRAPRHAPHTRRTPVPAVFRYAAAAVLLATIGIGLRQAFTPPDAVTPMTDAYRDATADSNFTVSINSVLADLRFSWNAVTAADKYRVVVWDLERAEMVGRYMVSETAFDKNTPEMAELKPKLDAGRLYAVRVDAIDKQNRLLGSSESIEFTPSN